MRVIVGAVGYPELCDYSAGLEVLDRLTAWAHPPNVVLEDLSYNPIAVVQRFQDEAGATAFERAILVSAVHRDGREAGTVDSYRWNGELPSTDEIQRAVTDAVTGVIALENTAVIGRYFGALPEEVVIVEIEPERHEFGEVLTDAVSAAVATACELVKVFATSDAAVAALPSRALAWTTHQVVRLG